MDKSQDEKKRIIVGPQGIKKKDDYLTIRIRAEDKEILRELARRDNRSLSGYVMNLVMTHSQAARGLYDALARRLED